MSPRLWLAKLSAVMPETGYHIRWHALFMEEARGITLHGLHMSRNLALSMTLLGQKLNKTQVCEICTGSVAQIIIFMFNAPLRLRLCQGSLHGDLGPADHPM